jgi:hypothetical protein
MMFAIHARPWRCFRLGVCLASLLAAACATDAGFTKEQLETALNAELMTGAGETEIQAFFTRHDFTYTYDAELRRYKGTVAAGTNHRLDIYIYTDNDKKLTIAQVLSTETPQRRPVTSLPPLDLGRRDNRF